MGGIKNKLSKLSNKITQGSPWVRGAASRRLAEGSLSTGLNLTTLTKYLGIACLSLTILSTLILNIVSSYSSSNINSNAEPVSNSPTPTLANTTLDPASISISISSYPSSYLLILHLRLPVAIILISPFRYLREVGLPPVDTPSQLVLVVVSQGMNYN